MLHAIQYNCVPALIPPKVSNVAFDPKRSSATGPQLWALCPNQMVDTYPPSTKLKLSYKKLRGHLSRRLSVGLGANLNQPEWSTLVPKSLPSKQVLSWNGYLGGCVLSWVLYPQPA